MIRLLLKPFWHSTQHIIFSACIIIGREKDRAILSKHPVDIVACVFMNFSLSEQLIVIKPFI